jgi:NADH-quinone oxidoreductase subunit B
MEEESTRMGIEDISKPYIYPDIELDRTEGEAIEAARKLYKQPIKDPDSWLEEEISRNILLTTADAIINWSRRSSIWPINSGLACCAFEMIATAASRFDISRFGMEIFRPSPRQADLLIACGTLTWKMAPTYKRIYEQMAEPKWVIAMGSCAISGGLFRHSYSVVPGINMIIPVDIYIPGCPPRPEALLHGIQALQNKIKHQSIAKKKEQS